jgi:orotate phosphoribosyltransferase
VHELIALMEGSTTARRREEGAAVWEVSGSGRRARAGQRLLSDALRLLLRDAPSLCLIADESLAPSELGGAEWEGRGAGRWRAGPTLDIADFLDSAAHVQGGYLLYSSGESVDESVLTSLPWWGPRRGGTALATALRKLRVSAALAVHPDATDWVLALPAASSSSESSAESFVSLLSGRPGHFRMESGYHASFWLELDAMFADTARVAPLIRLLADALRPHGVEMVCGPLLGGAFLAQLLAHELGVEFAFSERVAPDADAALYAARYRVPAALAPRLKGKRIALVDDVMSAGSSLLATYDAVQEHDGAPVVVGALLVLGSAGVEHFAARRVPVESLARQDFAMWPPDACPLCARGETLEDV